MSLVTKAAAFVLALALIGLGAGLLAVPLILYVFWGRLFRRGRAKTRGETVGVPATRLWMLAAAGLLLLAAASLLQGGRLSVVLFGGAGLCILLRGQVERLVRLSALRAEKESVLLRSRIVPFSWLCVAEVKLLTRNVTGALSVVDGEMLLEVTGQPAAYVVVRTLALSHATAMEKTTVRLRELAGVLRPAGGYLVPLDSSDAASHLSSQARRVRLRDDWLRPVQATPFDLVLLVTASGYVRSMGLYSRADGGPFKPRVPSGLRLGRPPLLWEVLKSLEAKLSLAGPDEVAGFVASLGARAGEGMAQKLGDGSVSRGEAVVATFAGGKVRLRATQLRALAGVYG